MDDIGPEQVVAQAMAGFRLIVVVVIGHRSIAPQHGFSEGFSGAFRRRFVDHSLSIDSSIGDRGRGRKRSSKGLRCPLQAFSPRGRERLRTRN
jgi:hypothetical protein